MKLPQPAPYFDVIFQQIAKNNRLEPVLQLADQLHDETKNCSTILTPVLAHDHPFYDGNGRTARALFYWSMLRSGYRLFEFVSISSILVKATTKYARSFLYTETDENDLNYFIIYQADVINRAIKNLHTYIERKRKEVLNVEAKSKYLRRLNHRQQALIIHALQHSLQEYTIAGHQSSHGIAYGTARADLLELVKLRFMKQGKRGKAMVFEPHQQLQERLAIEHAGDSKSVGERVFELRIDYGPGYRVYFKKQGRTVVILLAGGDKRTQTKDIKMALRLARNL